MPPLAPAGREEKLAEWDVRESTGRRRRGDFAHCSSQTCASLLRRDRRAVQTVSLVGLVSPVLAASRSFFPSASREELLAKEQTVKGFHLFANIAARTHARVSIS